MNIYAYVPDLMDRSKFSKEINFYSKPQSLNYSEIDLIIVDLDKCKDLKEHLNLNVKTIGFASHVNEQIFKEANSVGYENVYPRSVFFKKMSELLSVSDN